MQALGDEALAGPDVVDLQALFARLSNVNQTASCFVFDVVEAFGAARCLISIVLSQS